MRSPTSPRAASRTASSEASLFLASNQGSAAGRKAVLDRTNAMIVSERSLAEGHIETGITLAAHAAEQQVSQAKYRQLEAASAAAGRIAAGEDGCLSNLVEEARAAHERAVDVLQQATGEAAADVEGDAEEAQLECEKSRRVLLWASGTDEQIQKFKQNFESAQIKWKHAETQMRHIQALREEVDKTAGTLWAVESVQDSKAADSEGLDGDLWGSGVPEALVPAPQANLEPSNEPIVPKLALPGASSKESATAVGTGSTCDCGQPLMPGSKRCQTCGIQSQDSLNFKSGSFASSLSSLGLRRGSFARVT